MLNIKNFSISFLIVIIWFISGCADDESITVPWDIPDNPTVTHKEAEKIIDSLGGLITMSNEDISIQPISLIIPENALNKNETIKIKRLSNEDIIQNNYNSIFTLTTFSPIYELNSDSNKFDKDITLKIPYSVKNIDNIDSSEVKLIYYSNDKWNEVKNYKIDTDYHIITAYIDHFTPFVVKYTGWPKYNKEFNIKKIDITKSLTTLKFQCELNPMGETQYRLLNRFKTNEYSTFELITLVRLMKKSSNSIDKIIKEKQYHNAILLNNSKKMEFRYDNSSQFSSWNFGSSISNAWFGFNGFSGPYSSNEASLGIHRYLITAEFNGSGALINSPEFNELKLSSTLRYFNGTLIGDVNNELFKIDDDFITLDKLTDNSAEYYFEVYSCWAEAGFEKYALVTSKENSFTINSLNNSNSILREPKNNISTSETPSGVIYSDITSNSFKLSWDTILGADKYYVYIDNIKYIATASNNVEILGLSPLTSYNVQVSSSNLYGESEKSNSLTLSTLKNNLPYISNITVNDGDSDINITYDLIDIDNNNIDIYTYYSVDSGETWNSTINTSGQTSNIKPGNNKSFIWLSNEDIYSAYASVEIKLIPYDGIVNGIEARSKLFSLNIPKISNVLGVDGSNEISISYSLSNNADSLKIYYSKDNEENWNLTEHIIGNTENITAGNGLSFIWQSSYDVFSSENNIKIKIVPYYENNSGVYDISNGFSVNNDNELVEFNDDNLKTAIKDALNTTEENIYQSDLAQIVELNIDSNDIADLTGIEKCINLETLDLSSNNISDLSPIKDIISLKILKLYENNISDISMLSNLTSLELLDIDLNQISDLSVLSNFTSLKHLDIGDNPVSDITNISDLTNLEYFRITNSEITDLDALTYLTKLIEIDAENNMINNITSLSNLTNLERLNLGQNEITDVSSLSYLTELTDLTLQSNSNIYDISSLTNLSKIEELWISNTSLEDISVLENMTSLKKLYLSDNSIVSITSLSSLKNLIYIDLSNNTISDISSLVNNSSIDTDDIIYLTGNSLDSSEQQTNINTLKNRGVNVTY